MSDYLRRFAERFSNLDASSLDSLGDLYSEDILFRDPLHEVRGLPAMERYFAELYSNIRQLHFDFHGHDQISDGEGYLRWTLHYRHPHLRGGALIHVDGCSHLLWWDKVYQHRDYFDAGALLYEHVPLLGRGIAWLKGRLA